MAGTKLQNGEPKEYQSSLRYTKTVKNIVEKIKGDSFNQKFENLCLEFEKSVPDRKSKLDKLEKDIKTKETYLKELREEIEKYENIKREFQNFVYFIDRAKGSLKDS